MLVAKRGGDVEDNGVGQKLLGRFLCCAQMALRRGKRMLDYVQRGGGSSMLLSVHGSNINTHFFHLAVVNSGSSIGSGTRTSLGSKTSGCNRGKRSI